MYVCMYVNRIPKVNKQRQAPAYVGACKDCTVRGVSIERRASDGAPHGKGSGQSTVYPCAVSFLPVRDPLRAEWATMVGDAFNEDKAADSLTDCSLRPEPTTMEYVRKCEEFELLRTRLGSRAATGLTATAFRGHCEFAKALVNFDSILQHRNDLMHVACNTMKAMYSIIGGEGAYKFTSKRRELAAKRWPLLDLLTDRRRPGMNICRFKYT